MTLDLSGDTQRARVIYYTVHSLFSFKEVLHVLWGTRLADPDVWFGNMRCTYRKALVLRLELWFWLEKGAVGGVFITSQWLSGSSSYSFCQYKKVTPPPIEIPQKIMTPPLICRPPPPRSFINQRSLWTAKQARIKFHCYIYGPVGHFLLRVWLGITKVPLYSSSLVGP